MEVVEYGMSSLKLLLYYPNRKNPGGGRNPIENMRFGAANLFRTGGGGCLDWIVGTEIYCSEDAAGGRGHGRREYSREKSGRREEKCRGAEGG